MDSSDAAPDDAAGEQQLSRPAVPPASGGQGSLRSDWLQRAGGTSQRRWLLAAGIVLLVLAAGGAAALLLPGKRTVSDGADQGQQGTLPVADERDQTKVSVSGLSGRECADAQRRPIGVMLASDPINRPVSGFAAADMVFELPVLVSDVTRLLALYQCGRPDDIGSVRSARHDYLFLAEGEDAILAHWGGSYHALNRIAAGEFKTINALTNPYNAFFRKSNLPAPYNGFTTYENLWNALQKLGYRTETTLAGYSFQADPPPVERGPAGTLSIAWPGAFRVHYVYDPAINRYQRYWAGVKQVDGGLGGEPVAPSAVLIMQAANGPAEGPGGYNDVDIEGSGDLTVYQNGRVIQGRWEKNELYKNDPVHFLDESGQPIPLTAGQVWVMAVEPHIGVTWEPVSVASPLPAGATP